MERESRRDFIRKVRVRTKTGCELNVCFQLENLALKMDVDQLKMVFENLSQQNITLDANVIQDNFPHVSNKAFDMGMGFGYLSNDEYDPKAKVILQGGNPFVDNQAVSD